MRYKCGEMWYECVCVCVVVEGLSEVSRWVPLALTCILITVEQRNLSRAQSCEKL